jgi:hypothetical protein
MKYDVPDKYVGLVIGKNGETLKGIAARSFCKIYMPQRNPNKDAVDRTAELHGDPHNCEMAK